MKIRSVKATWLEVPIPEDKQHTSDFGRMRSFNTVLVRIDTEDGLVGHGEAKAGVGNLGDGKALVTLIQDELGAQLVGQDARRIAGHWEEMYNGSRTHFAVERGHVFPALGRRGLTISAISGIDIALWDLLGQSLGVPIWQLLGGKLRDWIPVTQCTGYKTPEHTAEDAQWGWERGFRVYKMKCIHGEENAEERIRYIVDRVEAIHRVLPEMPVRPDIRWRLEEVWVVQELVRRLEGHAIDCLESPIAKGAAGGSFSEWRRLRHCIELPVGDHVSGAEDLIRRFQAEALDCAIAGGRSYLEALAQSRLARDLGMGGWSQTVAYGPGAAMGLHVAACMPHLNKAYDMVGPMAWEHDLTNEEFPFEKGCFAVPDRPGLGYTLDHDAVAQYLVSERVFE